MDGRGKLLSSQGTCTPVLQKLGLGLGLGLGLEFELTKQVVGYCWLLKQEQNNQKKLISFVLCLYCFSRHAVFSFHYVATRAVQAHCDN